MPLADAFASFTKRQTPSPSSLSSTPRGGAAEGKNKQQHGGASHHEFFIHDQLLPLTIQLQKETRSRKYREIQITFQEAVTALVAFQSEEWPPVRGTIDPSNGGAAPPVDANRDNEEGEEVTVEFVSSVDDTTAEATFGIAATTTTSSNNTGPSDDDPQTREPVHPAVEATMEAFMAVLAHPEKTTKACELALDGMIRLISKRYVSGRAGGHDDTSGSGSSKQLNKTAATASTESRKPASLLHRILESVAKCGESNVESVQMAVVKTLRTIVTCPKCGVHEGSMLLALRTTFHVYLVTKSQSCKDSAKLALMDMLRSVFSRMEAYHAVAQTLLAAQKREHDPVAGSRKQKQEETTSTNGKHAKDAVDDERPLDNDSQHSAHSITSAEVNAVSSFASQYHADSYTLFRSLCKLSSKELPADTTAEPDKPRLFNATMPTDPLALSSKILSLELILAAMDYCGPAFCQEERFVHLVQHYLCVSLLKNCVSHNTQVACLSQKIFLVLTSKFKGHLKQEIELFFSNVFLRVLDSPNSSFKQKALVLESLRSLCGDPVYLTQIFLNYDCDFDAMNLYKDIVHMLTKLGGKATSAPSATVSKKDAEQDFELSLAGLEVLVTILKAFLRALGLPGGDEGSDDSAGSRIRGMLQLDVGAAAVVDDTRDNNNASSTDVSVVSSEVSGSELGRAEQAEGAASADVAGRIVDAFEMKRNAEQNFEIGAVKFTLSLKSGLTFFIDNGFVERDAREIALFFLANKDKLDKTQMGEALGREPDAAFVKGDGIDPEKGGPGFWFRLLHHYVEAQDFQGLMFDDAIRFFLSGFRLPGEAQKIDRIMETFATRFTAQNPDVFPSADTAFILAFSVIMLNTDLHNPSIKPERRMTVESFVKNNRGIGENGGDLPEDYLTGVFDRIKARPFSLKEDDAARERAGTQKPIFDSSIFLEGATFFGTNAEERKRENFKKERDEMMAVTEQLIRRRPERNGMTSTDASKITDTIAPVDVVKPMFDVTWGPMIGILSQVLECSDDERSVAVCLNGFVYAVRVASNSQMSLARDTFVSSLAKFTFLGSLKEMKRKNVESIRTLLSIAVIDGEHLGESWGPVLQCISQLARLRLTASGLDSDESFLIDKEKPKNSPTSNRAMDNMFWQQNRVDVAKEAEENNGRAVLEAVQEVLIDKVFSSTVALSAKSLAHFVEQLIAVSSSEIEGHSRRGITGVEPSLVVISEHSRSGRGDGPSIFSLQKLVEVADFNMSVRPRLVWAQVWELMADFFTKNACHENAMVSVFALDSLKQLSFKFLDKTELSEFNFQRLFLKPFLDVMENKNSREDVREMVLRCVDNIIRTKSHNLRSGWKIVFSILTFSASDPSQKVEYLGLAILQRLLDEHLHEVCTLSENQSSDDVDTSHLTALERQVRNSNADEFVNLCKASLSFIQREESASPRPSGLSMRALCHTAIYADMLAQNRILPPESGAQFSDPSHQGYTYKGLSEKESLEMVLWRPLFEGLAEGIKSPARSSVSGVGCLVPRASILALRAILLRHGSLFSLDQLTAILKQTVLPSIQASVESDSSPVIRITSESPAVSSIDFLVEPLPLPPPTDDRALSLFEAMTATPNRPMGPAELMLEASFTDLRHGGDGDLRRAYILAKKAEFSNTGPHEQPFPESWIATTAPVALGFLTDVVTELISVFRQEDRAKLWPVVAGQYRLWYRGREAHDVEGSEDLEAWRPCEALVRISSRELSRLADCLLGVDKEKAHIERRSWVSLILHLFSRLLSESTDTQREARRALIESKQKACSEGLDADQVDDEVSLETEYGAGRLIEQRSDILVDPTSGRESTLTVQVVALDFGAILYRPQAGQGETRAVESSIPQEVNVPAAYWQDAVSVLKIRCVAAYCLSQSLLSALDVLLPLADEEAVSTVLDCLNNCRQTAAGAVKDEVISTAFQQALLSDWGDGMTMPDETVEAAARLSLQHGSAVFFLAQEAGAARTIVHLLALLYLSSTDRQAGNWDRGSFAEPYLLEMFKDALHKFLTSEARDGHLVDPNTWRNAGERGGKLALYCTFFVPVVVEMLKTIRSVTSDQFSKHKHEFFSTACNLIRVESDEIRALVQEIFAIQVAPMVGVTVDLVRN